MKRFNYDIKHSVRSKSIFNSDFINDRVKRFFRNTEFKSQFVSVILKFTAEKRYNLANIRNKNYN